MRLHDVWILSRLNKYIQYLYSESIKKAFFQEKQSQFQMKKRMKAKREHLGNPHTSMHNSKIKQKIKQNSISLVRFRKILEIKKNNKPKFKNKNIFVNLIAIFNDLLTSYIKQTCKQGPKKIAGKSREMLELRA